MNAKALIAKYTSGERDFHGTDLRGADLRWANLRWTNLRGADLRGADLYGADLRGADLYGADLRGADLRGTDLRGADLRGADMTWADLYKANLSGAIGLLSIGPIGSRKGILYAWRKDATVMINCGCFCGSLDQFKERVNNAIDTTATAQQEYQLIFPLLDYFANK